jgi:hypothetical protein
MPRQEIFVRIRTSLALAALIGGAVTAPAAAQATWTITAELAMFDVSGAADGSVEEDAVTIGADRATMLGVRLERAGPRIGVGLALRHATPAFALSGPATTISDTEVGFSFYEIAPEVSVRLAGGPGGPTLRVGGGPVVDIWDWAVSETHVRLGARGGLGLDLPLGRRFSAVISGAAAVSGSIFDEEEVEPDFERTSVVRTEVGIGLRYRL